MWFLMVPLCCMWFLMVLHFCCFDLGVPVCMQVRSAVRKRWIRWQDRHSFRSRVVRATSLPTSPSRVSFHSIKQSSNLWPPTSDKHEQSVMSFQSANQWLTWLNQPMDPLRGGEQIWPSSWRPVKSGPSLAPWLHVLTNQWTRLTASTGSHQDCLFID